MKEQAINCQALNTGLFTQALYSGKTAWISSGGDPDNDFMTIYHGLHMSIARKSGYSGQNDLLPGARVFTAKADKDLKLSISSYSVNSKGTKNPDHEVIYPPSFSFGY